MKYSLNKLYSAVGLTEQAIHQYAKRQGCLEKNLMDLIIRQVQMEAAESFLRKLRNLDKHLFVV